jgi:hypothetical protein
VTLNLANEIFKLIALSPQISDLEGEGGVRVESGKWSVVVRMHKSIEPTEVHQKTKKRSRINETKKKPLQRGFLLD